VKHFEKSIRAVSQVCDRVAQLAVVAMMLIAVGNIVLRVIWRPVYGTYDMITVVGSIAVAFALAYCAVRGGHIAVEIIVQRLPLMAQAVIGSITGILSLGIFAIITWQLWLYGTDMWRVGNVTMSIYIPFYPFIYGVSFGCGVLLLVILVDLIKSVAKAVGK